MFKAKKMRSNKSGFTLIEVVLVLAIGGLIFLLAFIAFGQATKNRRDTSRRSEAARVISEIENAKGDTNGFALNSGAYIGGFVDQYLGGTDNGSTGGSFTSNNITYEVRYDTSVSSYPDSDSGSAYMAIHNGSKCAANSMNNTGNTGDYAVIVKLEKGSACRDNQ